MIVIALFAVAAFGCGAPAADGGAATSGGAAAGDGSGAAASEGGTKAGASGNKVLKIGVDDSLTGTGAPYGLSLIHI